MLGGNETLRKYKITGPSSNGKSFTLFFLSRISYNIIYINLKALKTKSYEKCIGMIISECSRLGLDEDMISNLNKEIQKIKTNTVILEFLLKVIEQILKYELPKLILILDQFKKENYESFPNFKNDIENLINENPILKVIYCASINDNELRDEVLHSFIRYNGLIKKYEESSQDFFFYYTELYKPKIKNKNTINWLFNNKPKYISFFNNKFQNKDDIYKDIISRIEKKIIKFRASSLKTYQYDDSFSITDILIYLRNIFYVKFEKNYIYEVLKFCPLKYLKIKFTEDNFIVKPIYPYFKYFINIKINKEECITFFKQKKYNTYEFQTNRLKGEYFEYAVQIALKNNKIIQLPNKENREITLYEISTMNKFSELKYDKMKDYYIEENNDDEKEEEEKEEEKSSDEEEVKNSDNEEEEEKSGEEEEKNGGHDKKEKEKQSEKNEKNLDEKEANKRQNNDVKGKNTLKKKEINQKEEKGENKVINNNIDIKGDYLNFIKNILEEFRIDDKSKKVNILDTFLSSNVKELAKTIEDYRKEIIKKNKKRNSKKKIEILIKQMELLNTEIKGFSGEENIFLDQRKENGECLDYAILYGHRDNKIFLAFQMKCYGINASLKEKVIDKTYIKDKIKNILFNSMVLFNCKITKWYYFLIFYYNKNDDINNRLNLKIFQHLFESDVHFLLYNPEENSFYQDLDSKPIQEIKLDDKANLDYNNAQLFNNYNFAYIPNCKNYNKELNYFNCINKFIKDFQFLSDETKKNPLGSILNNIKTILSRDELYFETCLNFENKRIDYPDFNKIYLYKKNGNTKFIAIINESQNEENDESAKFTFIDLEKKIKTKELNIDMNSKYYYCLCYKDLKINIKPKYIQEIKKRSEISSSESPPFKKKIHL